MLMAATAAATTLNHHHHHQITTAKPPRPKLVCFSFAAYAKTVIDHLKSLNIPVLPGLTDPEFNSLESAFHFSFPPDLRSILQEGLPVGPGFPNWRSSSIQQLHILINLPRFSLLKEVSRRNFWCQSWGIQPDDSNDAVAQATRFLDRVPVLVPIYRNCYIPSRPDLAGNPVFYANGGEFRVLSFDLTGFFQNHDYLQLGYSELSEGQSRIINSPAWAAMEARTVDFWTEVSEIMKRGAVARGMMTRGWLNDKNAEFEFGLEGFLEEVFWKLREGGWEEDEVREMMMTMDGGDEIENTYKCGPRNEIERLSEILLGGGWSREDVEYSLHNHQHNSTIANAIPEKEEEEEEEEESTFEINLERPIRIAQVECKEKHRIGMKQSMKVQRAHFFFSPQRNLIL